jgi:hypothetical protein
MDRLTVHPVRPEFKDNVWAIFAHHHYLTNELSKSSKCWAILADDGDMVCFTSVLPMPSGTLKDAWRIHRTVTLPDYQGMGIGALATDMVGEMHLADGKRLYSRTTHPRLARYRLESGVWRETEQSGRKRDASWAKAGKHDTERVAYSFEYIGARRLEP